MVRSSSEANTWNHVKAQCITTPDKSQCFRPFKRSEPECNPWCLFSAFRHGVMLNYCIKDLNIKSWKAKICTVQKLYAKNNYPGNMHLGSVKFMSSDSLVTLIKNPSDINNKLQHFKCPPRASSHPWKERPVGERDSGLCHGSHYMSFAHLHVQMLNSQTRISDIKLPACTFRSSARRRISCSQSLSDVN